MIIERRHFSLWRSNADIAKIFAHKISQKGIELQISIAADVDDVMLGDSVRVRQVLMNLVGNACKIYGEGLRSR